MADTKKWVWLLSSVIILAILCGGAIFYLWQLRRPAPDQVVSQADNLEAAASPTPPPSPINFTGWEYYENGYALRVPPGWQARSTAGGRTLVVPGSPAASLNEISITILADANVPQNQELTTQIEFDQWLNNPPNDSNIKKIDNVTVDGLPGVKLLYATEVSDWNLITWVRQNDRNYYLGFRGAPTYEGSDAQAIDYILNSFKFSSADVANTDSN